MKHVNVCSEISEGIGHDLPSYWFLLTCVLHGPWVYPTSYTHYVGVAAGCAGQMRRIRSNTSWLGRRLETRCRWVLHHWHFILREPRSQNWDLKSYVTLKSVSCDIWGQIYIYILIYIYIYMYIHTLYISLYIDILYTYILHHTTMLQYINDMNIHADFLWRYPPKQHIYKPHLQAGIVTDWMMDRCSTGCWTVQTLTTT